MGWTFDVLERHIDDAAITLKRWGEPDRRFLGRLRVLWPDTVPERFFDYGRSRPGATKIQPTAAQLDRMDRVLSWMTAVLAPPALPPGLPSDTSKIVWLRACGHSWKSIIRVRRAQPGTATARHSLRHVERAGYDLLIAYLRREGIEPDRDLLGR